MVLFTLLSACKYITSTVMLVHTGDVISCKMSFQFQSSLQLPAGHLELFGMNLTDSFVKNKEDNNEGE